VEAIADALCAHYPDRTSKTADELIRELEPVIGRFSKQTLTRAKKKAWGGTTPNSAK
jgi:hypothetical protein